MMLRDQFRERGGDPSGRQPVYRDPGTVMGGGDVGQPAQDLAGLLRGAAAYEQQGGHGGSVIGPHLHDAAGAGAPGPIHTSRGEAIPLNIGNRKFHVYFGTDGSPQVFEIKPHPQM